MELDEAIVELVKRRLKGLAPVDPRFNGEVRRFLAPSGVYLPATVTAYTARIKDDLTDVVEPGVTAPYRFVPLSENIVGAGVMAGQPLDRPLLGGFTGWIAVRWAAETPMLIGTKDGDCFEPMRLPPHGPFVIPGATIRGLVRSTCEIVAHARLSQFNRAVVPKSGPIPLAPVVGRSAGHTLRDFKNGHSEDMTQALFGYVYEREDLFLAPAESTEPRDIARRGRIAFEFATVESDCDLGPIKTTVMMAPPATLAPVYLKDPSQKWTDPTAQVVGRKRYFPHFGTSDTAIARRDGIYATLDEWQGEPSMQSRLKFLESRAPNGEIEFSGRIHVHNASAAEIGMVLWSLTHGGDPRKPYRHMIGRAKPAGAGQVRVKSITLALTPHDDDAAKSLVAADQSWELASAGMEGWVPPNAHSLAPFMRCFEAHMRTNGAPAWPQTNPVLRMLGASLPGNVSKAASRYMTVSALTAVRDRVWPPGHRSLLMARAVPAGQLRLPYRTMP